MPLPQLHAYKAADANAREYAKRVLLGERPEAAAAAVGAPSAAVLERNEVGQALVRAIEPDELQLLRDTPKELARPALETRENRASWLAGVMTGAIKFEGAFGNMKEFPPAAKLAASRLLGLMHGDFVTRHEVKVEQDSVIVFAIPDNGRVPTHLIVDCVPDET